MHDFSSLDALLEHKGTTISRDLKLNLKRLLSESSLAQEEAVMTVLATATSVEHTALASWSRETLASMSVAHEHIQETAESAAIMGMLNMYYRFRHMTDTDFGPAGLRMTSLAKPGIGKERFEMLALAVSVINGCQKCVTAHEATLRDAGVSNEKIHDLARIAAVVKGLKALAVA